MLLLPCPYLGNAVEITDERKEHIARRHPDLLPVNEQLMGQTLAQPDSVWASERFSNARLLVRWYNDLAGGKYVVVVVVSDAPLPRHWVITAYIARSLVSGVLEWERP
ncbi:MAG: hypothetical protein HY680_11055 [Chloroflexi bacterium]|nr:hypothetical protein [Chloroflexota bacterium]